ncbi:MAG TPA: NAD(P)H-dependent glycerol-3-phosphate dehydrogenase [Clostridiaceae bacterium]|nr:NAD(P)H-dependent glycerol-3-phosphate dehydrogenase [Clostridiaceae bacterium]
MGVNISVIGAGSMGTAISILLSKNGHMVNMWTPFADEAVMINTLREHIHKLPGVLIPEGVRCTTDLQESLKGAGVIVLALPSQTVRQNVRDIAKLVKENIIIVNCSKGLEISTGFMLSQVIRQEIPNANIVALSGPSHAEEIARDIPTAVVAASEDKQVAEYVQDIFMSPKFRVYTSPDIIGVEIGGAIKNVIALCAGISDGLGYGDNTKAALMTRGIVEISRLGKAMGAKSQTFTGLTGIGDLIVTCTSMHSRNRRAGILIGQGRTPKEAQEEIKMVVEGINTCKPACTLALRHNVSMPITFQAYEILFNGKNPKQAVAELMTRDRTHEIEEVVLESDW